MADTTTTQQTTDTTQASEDIFWPAITRIVAQLDDVYHSSLTVARRPIGFVNNDAQEISDLIRDLSPIIGAIYSAQLVLDPGNLLTKFNEMEQDISNNLALLQEYLEDGLNWNNNKNKIYPLITRLRTVIGAAGVLTFMTKPKS